MAVARSDEQMILYLNTQEKTIRYARSQIGEGDLINGKSMLDSTLLQLNKQSLEDYPSEYEGIRTRLVQ